MRLLFQILFWSALVFALIMASLPQLPDFPGSESEKIQHFIAFGDMAAFAALAYPRLGLPTILVVLASFGALIEIVQIIPALGRTASLLDWLADRVGASVVLLLIALVRRQTEPKAAAIDH